MYIVEYYILCPYVLLYKIIRFKYFSDLKVLQIRYQAQRQYDMVNYCALSVILGLSPVASPR